MFLSYAPIENRIAYEGWSTHSHKMQIPMQILRLNEKIVGNTNFAMY